MWTVPIRKPSCTLMVFAKIVVMAIEHIIIESGSVNKYIKYLWIC